MQYCPGSFWIHTMVLRAKSILPSRRVRVLSAHCGFVVALDALPNLPAASIFQVQVFFMGYRIRVAMPPPGLIRP